MKLWDIVKNVGSAAIQTALPGTGSLIVGAVNHFLDDKDKLPEMATGQEISSAIDKLPPEKQSELLNKEFDVKIEDIKQSNETLRTMLESESKSQHTTRPYIAKGSYHVLRNTTYFLFLLIAYGAYKSDNPLKIIMESWPFILSITSVFTGLLYAYFGVLKKESEDRLNASNKLPAGLGVIGSLFGRK